MEKKASLGMLFVKTNSKTGVRFLSGFLEIDGQKINVIANKAKTKSASGDDFYVLFENEQALEAIEAIKKTDVKKATVKKAAASEAVPF